MKIEKICLILVLLGLAIAPLLGGQLSVDPLVNKLADGEVFRALYTGPELPILQHLIIGSFFLIPLGLFLAFRRVIPTPYWRIMASVSWLSILLLFSLSVSDFKAASAVSVAEWGCYAGALYAIVVSLGRNRGPRLALSALAIGVILVGLIGILEYRDNRPIDPNWRIFAGWINPNALAGMLLLGLFPAISLSQSAEERLEKLLWGVGASLIAMALLLTQSKGGFLALGTGVVAWLIVGGIQTRSIKPLIGLTPLLVMVVFGFALSATQKQGSRLTNSKATEVQSTGFRTLLWKSAADLALERPTGWGMGTFRYQSSRPGRNTPTQLAHNSWLQLAAEASPLAPFCMLAILGVWFRRTWQGLKNHYATHQTMYAGVSAAIVASCAHNMVDSDWYQFGIGISFFALLGIGIQLCPDGSAPEIVPKPLRLVGLSLTAGLSFLTLLYFGITEGMRARVAGDAALQKVEELSAGIGTLRGLPIPEGDNYAVLARLNPSGTDLLDAQRSAELTPSIKNYRFLAATLIQREKYAPAESALNAALRLDPNNLSTLKLLFQVFEKQDHPDEMRKLAERVIAIEDKSYFKVRSIPEVIPTEIAEFRVYLASQEPEPRKTELLLAACKTYQSYFETTWPYVRPYVKTDTGGNYAGESMKSVQENLTSFRAALSNLKSAPEVIAGFQGVIDNVRLLSAILMSLVVWQNVRPTVPNHVVRKLFGGLNSFEIKEMRLVGPYSPRKTNPQADRYYAIRKPENIRQLLHSLQNAISERGDWERTYEGDTILGVQVIQNDGKIIETRFSSDYLGQTGGYGEDFANKMKRFISESKRGINHD
ncbi:MAG: O-antigen ligase family protein [Armatimonadetes bacterium]|nr:O-antigen ligase family protein [Armatimonadota bacterium]